MDVPDRPPQRVLVIHNTPTKARSKGEVLDAVSEREVVDVARSVAQALSERSSFQVLEYGVTADLVDFLCLLEEIEPLAIFNLCEGIDGDEHHESLVTHLLEFLRIPFTGNGTRALVDTNNKHRAKQLLKMAGVPVPESHLVSDARELDSIKVSFPVIVKPVEENASLGITTDSVVHDRESLVAVVGKILDAYRQPALVERYIEGREFNVSVIGNDDPRVLPLAEVDYSMLPPDVPKILFYEAKWIESSPYYQKTPVVCPASDLSASLASRIEAISLAAFRTFGCRGYARVDLRVSSTGRPYVLEVNANPSLATDAGLARSARCAGLSYATLVERVLELAVTATESQDKPVAFSEGGILPRVDSEVLNRYELVKKVRPPVLENARNMFTRKREAHHS